MRLDYSARNKLTDLILQDAAGSPLNVPYRIHIEPTNLCNFACTFCPTGHPDVLRLNGLQQGMMSDATLDLVVSGLAGLPMPVKRLHYYFLGESVMYKRLPEMVARCKPYGTFHHLRTNGARLTEAMTSELVGAGLTELGFSIEAVSDAKYKDITKRKVSYESIRDKVAHAYSVRRDCKIYVKIVDAELTDEEKQKFTDDFSPIADEIDIEPLMDWSAGGEVDFKLGTNAGESSNHTPLRNVTVCPYPFYTATIRWDGRVICCCVDWTETTEIGNLHANTFSEIWNGERLHEFRRLHLAGNRAECRGCRNCDQVRGTPFSDVMDDDARRIDEFICSRRGENASSQVKWKPL